MFLFRKFDRLRHLSMLAVIVCLAGYVHAQPVPPPNEDDEVPIPGIGILLAAGAAFGAKKAYDIYRRRGK